METCSSKDSAFSSLLTGFDSGRFQETDKELSSRRMVTSIGIGVNAGGLLHSAASPSGGLIAGMGGLIGKQSSMLLPPVKLENWPAGQILHNVCVDIANSDK